MKSREGRERGVKGDARKANVGNGRYLSRDCVGRTLCKLLMCSQNINFVRVCVYTGIHWSYTHM